MKATFKIDATRWQGASRNMASLATKGEPQELLKRHMKALLKTIVGITPPAQMSGGFSNRMPGAADRARGEASIRGDLRRIFEPLGSAQISQIVDFQGRRSESQFGHKGAAPLGMIVEQVLSLSEMKAWHQARRRKDGKVMQVNRDVTTGLRKRDLRGLDKGIVAKADFDAYLKQVFALVGKLAAGWNRAAELLALNMPAFIKRHGTSHGAAMLVVGSGFVRLSILNDVPFIDNVRGLERRVQAALNYSAASLERQYEAALKRMAKKAGFK